MVDDVDGGGPIVVVVDRKARVVPAGPPELRCGGVDSDVGSCRIAECRGGRRVVLAEIARQRRS